MSFTVRVFPSDRTGCGCYRIIYPSVALARQTTDVEIEICETDDGEGALKVTTLGRVGDGNVIAVEHPGCDVVVFQRPAHRHLVEAIPLLQAKGVAVVCEYDDDFDHVDPRNPAFAAYDPATNPMMNKLWAKLGSQLADLVTVSTPALAKRYGAHGRVVELPNYVPEWYLDIPRPLPDDIIHVGWAGNVKTHPEDLQVMGGVLRDLPHGARFRTIGSQHTLDVLHVDGYVVPWMSIEDYPYSLANFDIGLAPLKDTVFNRSKSWLKALELAAVGVPFVASPTQQYAALAALGAGDLVRTTTANRAAWRWALERLIEDADYRATRSEQGREAARALTYEQHAERWLMAWSSALAMRRAR